MNSSKREKLSQNLIVIIGIALIVTILGLVFITNVYHYCYEMNADIAAEAILGRVISETKQLIPSCWYPSTETRVINAANLAGLYNMICGKMNLSMGLASFTTTLLIVAAEIYLSCKWELKRSSTVILILLSLAIPSTMTTLTLLYLFASYYGACFIIFVLTLSLYAKSLQRGQISLLTWIVSGVLAFLLGLQGMRGILVIYAPLLAVEFLRSIRDFVITRKKSPSKYVTLIWSFVLVLFSFIGTKMPVSTGASTTRNIRHGFEKLIDVVIPSVSDTLGLGKSAIHDAFSYLLLLSCLIELIIIIRKYFRKGDLLPREMGFLVTVASPLITALIISFTTTDNSNRYFFMLLIAMAYSVPLLLENIKKPVVSLCGAIVAFIPVIFQMNYIYSPIITSEEPRHNNTYEVAQSLVDRDVKIACATFDYAGTIMCLTDGQVTVRSIDSMEQMNICQWLTNAEWFEPYPDTPVAVITTDYTFEDFERFLSDNDINVIEQYTKDYFHVYILEEDYM